MEETLQKETLELEYKDPDDNQGGIHRRLRDRDLLRKRKAEAEEKETNQVESRSKRARGEEKSSTGKRGRPRKTEPAPEITAPHEKPALAPEASSVVVVVVPESVDFSPAQTLPSLTPLASLDPNTVEPQPAYVPAAPAPIPFLASVPTPVLTLAQAPAPASDLPPAPAPIPLLASVPTAASMHTAFQGKEALDQVLIEDLGSDEEEDVKKEPSLSVPEQNKMFSSPTLSIPPPPQRYLSGNDL